MTEKQRIQQAVRRLPQTISYEDAVAQVQRFNRKRKAQIKALKWAITRVNWFK